MNNILNQSLLENYEEESDQIGMTETEISKLQCMKLNEKRKVNNKNNKIQNTDCTICYEEID